MSQLLSLNTASHIVKWMTTETHSEKVTQVHWTEVSVTQSGPTLTPGLQPARLLCPRASPGKDAGVGSHALLQRIFLTRGLNLSLPHHRQILHCLSPQGSPKLAESRLRPRGSASPTNTAGRWAPSQNCCQVTSREAETISQARPS